MTRLERFTAKYKIDENVGCWLWHAATGNGYGRFWVGGETVYAHRWAYEYYREPLPPAEWVDGVRQELDHLCKVRDCVNPWHLELVTNAENTQRGDLANLHATQVLEIRERYTGAYGEGTALAREYGISGQHISDIVNDKRWTESSRQRPRPQ